MGRSSKKGKTKLKAAKENRKHDVSDEKPLVAKDEKSAPYNIDQLLDKASEYIDTFEYEMAQRFCQRALEMDADNVRALEISGTLLLELEQLDNAKSCFGRAIELEPDTGHSKYMYLGQLLTGSESVQCFIKGIELMKKTLASTPQTEGASGGGEKGRDTEVTPQNISQAHCSVAEIFLTDECFDEAAETQCLAHLTEAVAADNTNPEAHHLMASFYLSTGDKQKAKESLEKGKLLWLPQMRAIHDNDDAATPDPTQACAVSYPARVGACKLMIEVEDYEEASDILEMMLDEDDEVLEVWYLLGWANHLQGDEYKTNARFYLNKAAQVASKLPCEDEAMILHVQELLDELGPGDEEEEEEDGLAEFDTDTDSDDDAPSATTHTEENMECS